MIRRSMLAMSGNLSRLFTNLILDFSSSSACWVINRIRLRTTGVKLPAERLMRPAGYQLQPLHMTVVRTTAEDNPRYIILVSASHITYIEDIKSCKHNQKHSGCNGADSQDHRSFRRRCELQEAISSTISD